MIWLSEMGGVDLGRDSADHYKLAPSMMSLMSRYVLDMESFWLGDKSLRRAIFNLNFCCNQSATYFFSFCGGVRSP
jgi:hypothetical protein